MSLSWLARAFARAAERSGRSVPGVQSAANRSARRSPGASRRPASWAARVLERAFGGSASPWGYALLRVSVAALVLARTTDWLRPLCAMDHHAWSSGLDHVEPITDPALASPLPPFPHVPAPLAALLGWARSALAVALLLGVRPRLAAALLAACGYALMASDRYHYFHHLHLLWLVVGLLALAPSDARASVLPRSWREHPGDAAPPRWPLVLIRAQALVVYAAAGAAKLGPEWLSGQLLRLHHQRGLVAGPLGALIADHAAAVAIATAATELLLVPLLAWRRSRLVGVALGAALHLGIESSMQVSTFGATMIVLLTAFLPWDRGAQRVHGPSSLQS